MKLTFFLIAFSLVFVRVYLSCTGVMRGDRGHGENNMTIISDNFREEIKWSGTIRLNDDETGFASITPGGYVKFRLNDKKLVAESNLQGEINYELYNDGERIALDSNGRKFIAGAVKELIAAGFDAKERIDRIYKQGGNLALLNEVGKQKTDQLNMMYMDRVFENDSIPDDYLPLLLEKISSLGADIDKMRFLRKFTLNKLEDVQIRQAYFDIVARLGADVDKMAMMNQVIEQGPHSDEIFDKIEGISHSLGADVDKMSMYRKLMEKNDMTVDQWITLINDASHLGSDNDKSQLLVQIAQKMPPGDDIKAAYLQAAKAISSDMDYGKAMRAINQ